MKKDINQILYELYEVDNSLKDKEEDLKKIIKTMLEIKPNINIDEEFKNNLKKKLNEKIEAKKLEIYQKGNQLTLSQIFSYIFGGAGILAFSFVFFNNYIKDSNHFSLPIQTEKTGEMLQNNFENNKNVGTGDILEDKKEITNLKSDENIISNEVQEKPKNIENDYNRPKENNYDEILNQEKEINKNPENIKKIEAPKVEETNETLENNSNGILKDEISTDMMSDSMPESSGFGAFMSLKRDSSLGQKNVNYSYSGKLDLKVTDKMLSYKKEAGINTNSGIINIISSLNSLGVNFSDVKNVGINNLNLEENKDYGYTIYVDFQNSSISFYKNWSKWPANDGIMTFKNILNQKELSNISNDFLKNYNIDLSKYGTPELDKNYIENLKKYVNGEISFDSFSNSTYIVYPLIIDGKEVYEESGEKKGVKIEIDLIDKKVVSVSGLEFNSYKSYEDNIETNEENILKIAKVGGIYGLNNINNGNSIEEILVNPKVILLNKYKDGKQIIVPGVMFNIEGKDGEIMFPLAKEFYNYDESGNINGGK